MRITKKQIGVHYLIRDFYVNIFSKGETRRKYIRDNSLLIGDEYILLKNFRRFY